MGTLPFICTGESTNDVVEFQARRTEVTSAVLMNGIDVVEFQARRAEVTSAILMNGIKLKMAQESKPAQAVTYGKSTAFIQLHFVPRELQFISFFFDKPLSEKKFSVVPKEGNCWQ